MRTPVAIIEGYLGMLINPATATVDARGLTYAQKAHESAQHLGHLFQDLLDVTKLDDNRMRNTPILVDAGAAARQAVDQLQSQAAAKNLKLTFEAAGQLQPMRYSALNKNGSVSTYSVQFCPSQQYWYMHNQHSNSIVCDHANKKLKFAFAMTDNWSAAKDRQQIIRKLEYLAAVDEIDKSAIMFRYTSNRADTVYKYKLPLLSYDEYMKFVKQAKFTLVIPSYDVNCFSLRRFFEALTNGCIPLILDTCNYKAGFNFLEDDIIKFIEDNLLVSIEDLSNMRQILEDKCEIYDTLLQQLKATKWYRAYANKNMYINYLNKIYSEQLQ
jgi:hypothetical protein